MRPIHIIEFENALIEEAKAKVPRDIEQGMQEAALEQALATLITVDLDRERLRRAKEIISNKAKPGGVDPAGAAQLFLPGLDPYFYEPDRLVRDDAGRIIENYKATIKFKQADARRARDHAADAQKWASRKTEESEIQSAWATEQALKGRPALDLTWGNCVAETGLLRS
jgi:hypothetical protein